MLKKINEFDHDDANYLCGKVCKSNNDECVKDKCPLYREGECKAYLFKQLDTIKSKIEYYFKDEKAKIWD